MSKLRVQSFGLSLDGYGAGPDQSLDNPLGVRGPELMEWFFPTRVWQRIILLTMYSKSDQGDIPAREIVRIVKEELA